MLRAERKAFVDLFRDMPNCVYHKPNCFRHVYFLQIAAEVTTQSQARKNSTTISKVKASSLSECDRFEEMLEPKMKRPSEGEVSIDPIPMGSRVHPDHVAVKQKIECTNSLKPVDQLPDRPKTNMPTKRSANDFRFGKTIGEGSFSTVYLAKDIHTGKECASKFQFNTYSPVSDDSCKAG